MKFRLIALAGFLLQTPAYADAPPHRLDAVPLSTSGSQIVDANGQPTRIHGVGMWYDEDAVSKVPGIARAGFNTIRLDWSNRALHDGGLRDLDRVIDAARRHQLRVILDAHSNEAGTPGPWKPCYAQQQNGLWYDRGGASGDTDGCGTPGTVTDERFVADWQAIARHYLGNTTVIGYDLWNEPLAYGKSTWEPGDHNPEHNIRWMCERVGNAILAIDPTKLIICEGPMNATSSAADALTPAPWGDLSLAARLPVGLIVPHKIVYSIHDYPATIGGFRPDAGVQKIALMNKTWGYLVHDRIAPVIVGEMGASMVTPQDQRWANTLIAYVNGNLAAFGAPHFRDDEQGISTIWWFAGHDPNGDPSGIFDRAGNIDPVQQATYSRLSYQP
jgi:endoglucanase/chitinase